MWTRTDRGPGGAPRTAPAIWLSLNDLASNGGESGAHRRVASNLVLQRLGGDDGNLLAHALVGLEVKGHAGIVPVQREAACTRWSASVGHNSKRS